MAYRGRRRSFRRGRRTYGRRPYRGRRVSRRRSRPTRIYSRYPRRIRV